MTDDANSQDRDPWVGGPDPQTDTAIGVELKRIIGNASSLPEDAGINWSLPMTNFDKILEFLRETPSDIGMRGLVSRLRNGSGKS